MRHGYRRICKDIRDDAQAGGTVAFEDWWVHPDRVGDPSIADQVCCDNHHWKDVLATMRALNPAPPAVVTPPCVLTLGNQTL